VLKRGHFGKSIRNSCEVLKCGVEKDGEDNLERSCEKRSTTYSEGGEECPSYNDKGVRLTGLVTSRVGTAF
jgi:hypothetical protein